MHVSNITKSDRIMHSIKLGPGFGCYPCWSLRYSLQKYVLSESIHLLSGAYCLNDDIFVKTWAWPGSDDFHHAMKTSLANIGGNDTESSTGREFISAAVASVTLPPDVN